MRNNVRKILSAVLAATVAAAAIPGFAAPAKSAVTPFIQNSGTINVLTGSNAKFEMLTSAGTIDGAEAIDGDIITRATTGRYNGIPIFNLNGESGSDYIILMTVEANESLPIEQIKMNYEFGQTLAGGQYYGNGGGMYLNKAVIPWAEGFSIHASNDGKIWEKVYSADTLEGKLLTEKRPETLWDPTDGKRTYYDFKLDKAVTAKYIRFAISEMKPWLGAINIPEIEFYGKPENVQGYNAINVTAPECAETEIAGAYTLGEKFGKIGSDITLTVIPDEVSQVNGVTVNGESVSGKNGVYTFKMPKTEADINVDAGIKDSENVPLTMESASVAYGSEVKKGVVPVVTFTFNNMLKAISKDDILVNGKENSGLIQQAFLDAKDNKRLHIAPYSDKLEAGKTYEISLKKDVKSKAGMALDGEAKISFTTSLDYHEQDNYTGIGYIQGYEDGTFRPENDVTLEEALIMAKRLNGEADYSAVKSGNEAAKRIDMGKIIYIMKNGKSLSDEKGMFASLINEGIIEGYEDGTFRENANVTRAEATALFNRASGQSPVKAENEEKTEINVENTGFADVPGDYWAAKEIKTAAKPGINGTYTWNIGNEPKEYDVMNKKGSEWKQIPAVSQKLRDMGVSGGEGGQWMQAIEVDNVDGQLLFGGVDIATPVRSTDGGKTWTRAGAGIMATGAVDIKIDPNNKNRVILVGSCSDSPVTGVYLSENMGDSWEQVVSYGFNGQRDTRKQLAWDKSSYDETIGGSKIAYWSNMYKIVAGNESSSQDAYMADKWVKPTSDRVGGLYKTEDGGKTWFLVNSDMSDCVLEVNPVDGTLYAGNERGFFRSEDGGKSFEQILSGEPIYGLDVIETRPNNVYINDNHGVLISEDGGKTFKRVEATGFPTRDSLADVRIITRDLAVSPANPDYMLVDKRDYFVYKNIRYFTHDGGKTWTECGDDKSKDFFFNHNRQHPFAWHPTDANKVWSLGGDWITSSSDGGETFIWDANGYCGTPPGGRFNFNPYNPELIFAGAQDLLGLYSQNNGYTWEPVKPENGGGFGCSYGSLALDENLLIAAIADGWYDGRVLKVSHDGGKSFGEPNLPLKDGLNRRSTSFWVSASDPKTIFAGEYVSHDRSSTWKEMSGCNVVMAINYYHNKEAYGILIEEEETITVSYDNGDTWYNYCEILNDDQMAHDNVDNPWSRGEGQMCWDVEYDGINNILYYVPGNVYCGTNLIKAEDNIQVNIGINVNPQEVAGDYYMHVMAIDPRYPDILYVGTYGSGNYKSQVGVQRSCDGGESFQTLTCSTDSSSVVHTGPTAGMGAETLVVHPETGDLWLWSSAEGIWTFPAPYEN